ncbi:pro-sigmaK processing inhibitor BofA family protein [Pueribacillus sp. YX66]|uniref:pro-sigmaK processing inhibitor BofA family protein n=1 Tax=Pueribacillus sp. YX66 TaxID=3229242 RepID=UPI00358D94C9
MDSIVVISIVACLIVFLLLFGAPMKPLRFIGQGFIKLMIGALLLFFLNVIGGQFHVHIPINLVTVSVSGFLGIPGLAALVAIDQIIL